MKNRKQMLQKHYKKGHFSFIIEIKNRQPLLVGEIKERFWNFMDGIAKQNEIKPLCIGGVADHVPLLLSLPTTLSVAKSDAAYQRWILGLGAWNLYPPPAVCLAVWLRSVHGQCLSCCGNDHRYPKLGGTSSAQKLPGRRCQFSKETRYRLWRTISLELIAQRYPGVPPGRGPRWSRTRR